MADHVTPAKRREIMRSVSSKDTGPELVVRSSAHRLGLRFRLHRKDLPGKPDLVFPRYRIAMFVHGCFWHRHKGCRKASTPKSNTNFWELKFERNVERDKRNVRDLKKLGWDVVTVWQCQVKSVPDAMKLLKRKLLPLVKKKRLEE